MSSKPLEGFKKSRQQQLAVISEKYSKDKNVNWEDIKVSELLKQAEDDITHCSDAKGLLASCSAINRQESTGSRGGNASR